jgi:imidazolonepropionase-like amidohydrolase
MINKCFFIGLIICAPSVMAQNWALRGGTIHTGTGTVISQGTLLIENKTIVAVLDGQAPIDTVKYPSIWVKGQQVYPGIIAPNTSLGLLEIELVRSTRDNIEVGELNPHVRSIIAYNTDSKIIPTVCINGVTTAQIVPQGGLVSGQSSVVALAGWNWEDAVLATDNGLHINFPRLNNHNLPENIAKEQALNVALQLEALQKLFDDAVAYKNSNNTTINLKLAAMQKAISKQQKVFIHVHFIKEIIEAVLFIEKNNLDGVLVDAEDAYLAIDFLKLHKQIPIILGSTHSLPNRADAALNQACETPLLLQQANIEFCLQHTNWSGNQRNLPFVAGSAAACGLPPEKALQAITYNTAKILGIDKWVGSLAVGKLANIVISQGDILDMATSKITTIYIEGKSIPVKNFQNTLAEKYLDKYQKK